MGNALDGTGAIPALNILDFISDAVAALNEAWCFTYVNASTVEMARLPEQSLLGGNLWNLFPELVGTDAERHLRRTMQERTRTSFEHHYEPFGLWVEVNAHPTPGGLTLFVRDVTSTKQAEEEQWRTETALRKERERLRLSEERFRVAFKSSPTVVFNQDSDLRYTWVYNTLREFQDVDWIGKTDDELGPAGAALMEIKREVLRTGTAVSRELTFNRGGDERHYQFHLQPLRGAGGVITGLTGSATEVTQMRRAEALIADQERQLRIVIDAMPALVAYVGRDFRYRFVNRRYSEWFGRPASEIEGRTIEEAFGSERWRIIEPKIRRALEGETVSYTLPFQYPDQARWVRATYVPEWQDGNVRGAVILVQDITDAHRAEEELKRSAEHYRLLANALPQMVWVASGRGETEFLNDYWYEYTGATREEGIRAWGRVVPADDAAAVLAAFQKAAGEGKAFDIEHRIRRGWDAMDRWHLSRIKPITDENGAVVQWVGTSLDIHDRKTSELELSKARRDLADILESITESFIAVDREWRFLYVNARVGEKLGVARESLIGKNMWDAVPESARTAFYPNYQRVMTERVPMHFEVAYPGDKWYEVYAHPTETGLSAYIVDKTEHKKAQEALRQKAKLESIGLLAGGVAHDFNNLLVGILGAASLAEEMVDQDRPERELLRLISDSAERAASLTRQMLTYAGKSKTDRLPVDLNRIVIDTVQLLRSTIPPAIQITLDLTPGAPMLTGDPGQVQQIVLNLLTNAIEAIPQGSAGAVRVKTALWKNAGAGPADMENLAPGDYVELQVTDSGLGMTRDVMDRIFDPFFTTKFAGRGLGLAAVQGIVRSHQGSIDVQSEPGHGTTFRVLLRASEGIHEPAPPETRVAPRGNGTVLVIDDESVVRATSERMLSHGGYNVLVAATGAEGIETFREKRHELTAVIIDVSMPDRTGFDVLRELRAELDGVRVFLSSGHGQQDLESELANFPAARFLKKPYRAEELLKALALGA